MTKQGPCYGGLELGGTKTICLIGSGPEDIRAEARFSTRHPDLTLADCLAFLRRHHAAQPLTALGIASFGPLDRDPASPGWGRLFKTPKPGWSGVDIVGPFAEALGIPVIIETDVAGAAYAEGRWGAARGLSHYAYVTVGTGIGGALINEGRLVQGISHSELGHIAVPHDRMRDPYEGVCPFHGDCLEGLASGPAIAARWGLPAEALPPDHPAFALEAEYLSALALALILIAMPERILWGGGVMQAPQLLPLLRSRTRERLGGYLPLPPLEDDLASLLAPAGLGARAGPLGALALAMSHKDQA
ncbi:MAG: ROK family protein [Rhodothalassiaceae bacterium]